MYSFSLPATGNRAVESGSFAAISSEIEEKIPATPLHQYVGRAGLLLRRPSIPLLTYNSTVPVAVNLIRGPALERRLIVAPTPIEPPRLVFHMTVRGRCKKPRPRSVC